MWKFIHICPLSREVGSRLSFEMFCCWWHSLFSLVELGQRLLWHTAPWLRWRPREVAPGYQTRRALVQRHVVLVSETALPRQSSCACWEERWQHPRWTSVRATCRAVGFIGCCLRRPRICQGGRSMWNSFWANEATDNHFLSDSFSFCFLGLWSVKCLK